MSWSALKMAEKRANITKSLFEREDEKKAPQMKSTGHETVFAALILLYSSTVHPAQSEGNRAGSALRKPAVKPVAEHSGRPGAAKDISSAVIEQVQVTRVDQHTQVGVRGSGQLSCVPFRLSDPERLVSGCSNARGGTRHKVVSSDLAHLGQF